jgi:hypothetical protein
MSLTSVSVFSVCCYFRYLSRWTARRDLLSKFSLGGTTNLQPRQGRKMKGKLKATNTEPSRCQVFLAPYFLNKK